VAAADGHAQLMQRGFDLVGIGLAAARQREVDPLEAGGVRPPH